MAMLSPHMTAHRLWRLWLSWKFRLLQSHRYRRLTLECVDGVPLLVLADVFNPKLFRTGEALARNLERSITRPGMRVLDMGTGSGIAAIFAARRGADVVAVDINAEAVRCARINAALNHVDLRIDVRQGDLFAPAAGETFDLVAFNPPYFRGQPSAPWEYAWRSEDVLERFAAGLREALRPGGRAVIALSTHAAGAEETLTRHALRGTVVWERRLIGERLFILEMTLEGEGASGR